MVAIVTQRPRPGYIYPLSLLLMAFTGVALRAIVSRLRISVRIRNSLLLLSGLVVMGYELRAAVGEIRSEDKQIARPLLGDYRRIEPYDDLFRDQRIVFASNTSRSADLLNYLGVRRKEGPRAVNLQETTVQSFVDQLATSHASILFLRGNAVNRPEIREWRASQPDNGWRTVANSDALADPWLLAKRDFEKE
jgi:hypothetical protein